jgi:hypothetical protein
MAAGVICHGLSDNHGSACDEGGLFESFAMNGSPASLKKVPFTIEARHSEHTGASLDQFSLGPDGSQRPNGPVNIIEADDSIDTVVVPASPRVPECLIHHEASLLWGHPRRWG